MFFVDFSLLSINIAGWNGTFIRLRHWFCSVFSLLIKFKIWQKWCGFKKNPSKYHIFKKKVDDATSVLLWYVFDSLSILLKRDFILFCRVNQWWTWVIHKLSPTRFNLFDRVYFIPWKRQDVYQKNQHVEMIN